MGALSKSVDLVYTLRFLRLLTTPFEKTTAYELGLIDDKGNKLKKPFTEKEKSSYNTFHRLVFNIKKLMAKVPGGSSKIASYASALYLIKEHLDLTDEGIGKLVDEIGINDLDALRESSQWFCTSDKMISPGSYKIDASTKMLNRTVEEMGKKNDKVFVEDNCYPVGQCVGLEIYEAIHISTGQKMYITAGEISK